MKNRRFDEFVSEIMRMHDEAHMARARLLADILKIRIMNEIVQVADALLLELDPEGLTRRAKSGDDDSDVSPLDDPDQARFQFEAHGADSFDPAAPHEDLNETLSEASPINGHLRVVQGRPADVDDLARRQ